MHTTTCMHTLNAPVWCISIIDTNAHSVHTNTYKHAHIPLMHVGLRATAEMEMTILHDSAPT